MHDPDVVAWEFRRPWPQRSSLPATGTKDDGVRWRIRLHHDHFEDEAQPGTCAGCHQPMTSKSKWFPWWKPSSYASHSRLAGRDYYWPPVMTVWHREPGGRDALSICRDRYQDKAGKWHLSTGWRYHFWHYHLQFPPLQKLRRRLLTRCAWCGGRDAKGGAVNHSLSWDGPRGRWWQGEPGLYHGKCTELAIADHTCTCDEALTAGRTPYGKCLLCGRLRPYGMTPERLARARALQAEGAAR